MGDCDGLSGINGRDNLGADVVELRRAARVIIYAEIYQDVCGYVWSGILDGYADRG